MIEAYGSGQRIRGRRKRSHRPTLIVCDDLQNESHIVSAYRRSVTDDWFHGTLLKSGTKQTNIVNLATALHRDALAMQLDRTAGWQSRIFQSIVRWPKEMDLWQEWEALYCDREQADATALAKEFFERHRYEMEYGPGTILDAPAGLEYEFPATGIDAGSFVTILQAELRAIAARLVMPEFMFTSDASNASFSSTMVEEGPAVKMFERLQVNEKKEAWKQRPYLLKRLPVRRERFCENYVPIPCLEINDGEYDALALRRYESCDAPCFE